MRRLAQAIAVGAAATVLVLSIATPASAHSQLVGSTPAEGETLAELPTEFSITMNERLLDDAGLSAFALRVRDADGLYYGDGCLQVADDTMSTEAAIGAAGDYVLEWQVVSADGHPVGGEIPFTWTGEATAEGSTAVPSCGAEVPPGDSGTSSGHHETAPAQIPLGDVVWIVAAVLVVAIAVTVALLATRRRR
ncbi:MAG: copper resistance CopC family protein [Protaetiibacter sp.]